MSARRGSVGILVAVVRRSVVPILMPILLRLAAHALVVTPLTTTLPETALTCGKSTLNPCSHRMNLTACPLLRSVEILTQPESLNAQNSRSIFAQLEKSGSTPKTSDHELQ